jgi:hypothetical protein
MAISSGSTPQFQASHWGLAGAAVQEHSESDLTSGTVAIAMAIGLAGFE